MKIRKVSADVLDRPAARRERTLSPREKRRLALQERLAKAITGAQQDQSTAFQLELETGEKASTMRVAFNRVRDRLDAKEVNLFSRDGTLLIANRPQTRGRRVKS